MIYLPTPFKSFINYNFRYKYNRYFFSWSANTPWDFISKAIEEVVQFTNQTLSPLHYVFIDPLLMIDRFDENMLRL